jgi:hypothetical protein
MAAMAEAPEATVTRPAPERSAAEDEHVAVIALVPGRPARCEQRPDVRRFGQREAQGRVLFVQRRRTADGRDAQRADAVRVGRERMRDFRRSEGDGVGGARDLARARARIALHPRGQVHGHYFGERKPGIDRADPFERAAVRGAFDPGAEQRIDDQRRLLHPGMKLAGDRTAAGDQHVVVGERVAFDLFGRGGERHVERARMEARVELPRHHHAVSAVVALAAQHHDALPVERREGFRQEFHHAVARVLHQDQAGNAELDGAPVHFPHLCRGQDFHAFPSASSASSLRTFSCSPIAIR